MVYTTIVRLVEPDPVWLQQFELTERTTLNVSIAGELHRTSGDTEHVTCDLPHSCKL